MFVLGLAPKVEEQPEVSLSNWSIIKVLFPDGHREVIFVGDRGGGIRLSTNIVEYERLILQGKTESGRVYNLSGAAAPMNDKNLWYGYWRLWLDRYQVEDWMDVTNELVSRKVVKEGTQTNVIDET
jgi:hypothetical protein